MRINLNFLGAFWLGCHPENVATSPAGIAVREGGKNIVSRNGWSGIPNVHIDIINPHPFHSDHYLGSSRKIIPFWGQLHYKVYGTRGHLHVLLRQFNQQL